jgi:hypothetical protein
MAGDWIPMRVDLLDDPAVIAIAAAVGLDEYAVAGRLLKLWSWANRHLKDGHACVPDKWVDDYLDTAGFAAAMLDAGWLRTRSGGGLEFTSFDRWNSNGAKIRLGETLRKRAFREKKATPPGVPEVSRTLSRTKTGHRPGPEKRREESKDPPTPQGGGTAAKRAKPPRPPNPLFDAIAEVCGVDPATAGRLVGGVAATLAAADPPYSPDEVREFARRYRDLCPWAGRDSPPRTQPTPKELEKWIGKVRTSAPPAAPERVYDEY